MFFEASRFGCSKMNFDATKVTYNTYPCDISGMSCEMMKMDGRDSAECQNWEKKDVNVIFEIVKLEKDKTQIMLSPTFERKERKREKGRRYRGVAD